LAFRDCINIDRMAVFYQASTSLSVDAIVSRANLKAYYEGKDGKAEVMMTIIDRQGRERIRQFTILRMDLKDGGEQKYYTYFSSPTDVRNMAFMVWKHIGKDDDRWLYLPALDLVNRIAAGDKRTSFAGSHFLYEDISGRGIAEDIHELIETSDKHFVLKNTPRNPGSVEFSSYTIWIDRSNFMPMKAEYFDKNGQKYRVIKALKVETIQGHPTITLSEARDLKSGGKTITRFSNIKYDIGLSEDIFTQRYLRRPPRKWMQ
jgi:outer membrane lipoprotein-sorting protein